uniref:Uncharacterized protein n=1 Tax=Rhizophora mucronata TaxID=61149 RepID=A0A2P2Q7V6_RHIMU
MGRKPWCWRLRMMCTSMKLSGRMRMWAKVCMLSL